MLERIKAIDKRIKTYVPETSLVGVVMRNFDDYTPVKSDNHLFLQHDLFSWHVDGKKFETVQELSRTSRMFDSTMNETISNLSDAQFTALVNSGGVAGLNYCRAFLGLGEDVGAVVAHAEHWLSLGGEKAVCLGGDLDGISRLPEGMTGVESVGAIYNAMLRKNWSEDLVRDIFYRNLRDFFGRAMA